MGQLRKGNNRVEGDGENLYFFGPNSGTPFLHAGLMVKGSPDYWIQSTLKNDEYLSLIDKSVNPDTYVLWHRRMFLESICPWVIPSSLWMYLRPSNICIRLTSEKGLS